MMIFLPLLLLPLAWILLITTKDCHGFSFQKHRIRYGVNLRVNEQRSSSFLTESDWKFLDGVYLITTDQSNSLRLSQTKETLESCGLSSLVELRRFKTDDNSRIRGCYNSHMSVLKEIQKKYQSKAQYRVLILEDNIETTPSINKGILQSIQSFLSSSSPQNNSFWDIFHLAYMMYVPGLKLLQLSRNPISQSSTPAWSVQGQPWSSQIVQMFAEKSAVVGTSAYIVSEQGVQKLLARDAKCGFTDAIPNIMAELFPDSRFACYPMIFHRAGKVNSLVNPQLDNFRRVMFSPAMYTVWERLMVSTGQRNNELFPTITITLLIGTIASLINIFTRYIPSILEGGDLLGNTPSEVIPNLLQLIGTLFPLGIALWGASLFQPGNTGKGFAVVKDTVND